MPGWQGKSRGMPWGYRIFVGILNRWGVLPAYVLLRFVAFYYFLFSYKASKNVLTYFRQKIGYGPANSLIKLYRHYYLLVPSIIVKADILSGIPHKFTCDFVR